jgi:hypothetical protein
MKLRTCVLPSGEFAFGIHKPAYEVGNLRKNSYKRTLGTLEDGTSVNNEINFPDNSLKEDNADWIFEIPNAFPFRGTTFIAQRWAARNRSKPDSICLPAPKRVSFFDSVKKTFPAESSHDCFETLLREMPKPLQIALASSSTDSRDLTALALICCSIEFDEKSGEPAGMKFEGNPGGPFKPKIENRPLFEVLANNPNLPDRFKEIMVLRPGIQGGSEIVGEWLEHEHESHIYEYLRRNSYIPWGHYAANMADDAIRYRISDLSFDDMRGLRHLYYQRTYLRMAEQLEIEKSPQQDSLSDKNLETLRMKSIQKLKRRDSEKNILFNRTLWGWNFGFDYAPSHYRLHASHQQIHQQYAMIPAGLTVGDFTPYACGDLIEAFSSEYREKTGVSFFEAYLNAIRSNRRMDGELDRSSSLVIFEDEHIMLFVPKAQTSQWELQLMTVNPVGNILEADMKVRCSIDKGIFTAVNILSNLGARMITSIEFSKRMDQQESDQRLLYAFLPRLPESPGAFSEAQLRWINGHYPEDFAIACRNQLESVLCKMT